MTNAPAATADGEGAACRAATREIVCDKKGGYLYTFTVTNNTGSDVTSVLVTPPQNGGFSVSPQIVPLPNGVLPDGQSATLQVTISGGQPGQQICFPVTLLTKRKTCCTIQVCVTLPNCCAAIVEPRITCNPDGTYSYTFTITNKTNDVVQHIYLIAPSGTTMTPSYFPVNLNPGASATLTIRITGAHAGRFCFGVSLHTENMKTCCAFDHCIELPECGAQSACAAGICCARAPRYDGTRFTGQKVAVVTGDRLPGIDPAQNMVVTVFDVSGANGFGVNGATPPLNNTASQYNGPANTPYNAKNLGSVFGVTLDHLGNIYVTASVAYSNDVVGPGGPGAVYKLDTVTGQIHTFAQLPNTQDGGGRYPGLGNITFNCRRKEFYVTNRDDGRIYRLDMTGTVTGTFDHTTHQVTTSGNAEPGDPPGIAGYGEVLWGVASYNDRVYYAVENENCGRRSTSAAIRNEIWSVGLTTTGNFDGNDVRRELQIPDLAGSDFSNPTSDIGFSADGNMFIAERTMSDFTTPNAHTSRVLEFLCTRDGWVLAPPLSGLPYKYNVGEALTGCVSAAGSIPSNAAGGLALDYDQNATYGLYATGDALRFSQSPQIYGFQLFRLTGGSVTTSPLLTLYGQGQFKMQIGDIAVSCPPVENLY